MKTPFLTSAMMLLALGTAFAQQPNTPVDTTKMERYVYVPEPNPMLTAADSARERSRLANAAALRRQKTAAPAKVATSVPLSPMTGDGATAPVAASKPDPAESKRVRDQQSREMMDRALSKKGRKQVKTTNKQIKKLDQAAAGEQQ